jgi:hypothetical protein
MFHAESYYCDIAWLHFDSVSTWRHPEKRQIQSIWGSALEWPTHLFPRHRPAYYTSAKLDGVREITPCMMLPLWYHGQGEKITGLLLSYTNGTRSSVGEVRPDRLGTPKAVISDTMFIQYKGTSQDVLEANRHLVEFGIDWFGFSEPLSSVSSDEKIDNVDDESHETDDVSQAGDDSSEDGDYHEPVKRTNTIAVPMSGRLD